MNGKVHGGVRVIEKEEERAIRRYHSRDPYTSPEVRAAAKATGVPVRQAPALSPTEVQEEITHHLILAIMVEPV